MILVEAIAVQERTMDRIPMTQNGYDKKQKELEALNAEMVDCTNKVAEARAEGDLKENAEYHAQRERQGMLQAKINLIKDQLSRSEIIDPASLPKDTVVFGARVRVKDLDELEEEAYELVGPGEEDFENDEVTKIRPDTPVGRGLMGRKIGEVAEVEVPAGILRYEILEISYPMLDD